MRPLVNPFPFAAAGASVLESARGTIRPVAGEAVGTTYVLSISGEMKALKLHSGPLQTGGVSGGNVLDMIASVGWATSDTSRFYVACQDDHNAAATNSDRADGDDCVWAEVNTSGTISGKVDVQSWTYNSGTNTTTITLRLDAAVAVTRTIHWYAVGGAGVTAAITSHSEPGATGNQDITVGLTDPDLLEFFSAGLTAATPATSASAWITFGACATADLSQAMFGGGSQDTADPTNTARGANSDSVLLFFNSGLTAIDGRAAVTGVSGNVVSLNWANRASTRRFWVMAIRGISAKVVRAQLATSGASVAVTTTFRPKAGWWWSHCWTQFLGPGDNFQLTMGNHAGNSLTSLGGWTFSVRDALATASNSAAVYTTANILMNVTSVGGVDAQVALSTLTDTGVTITQSDAVPNTWDVWGVLMGDKT